MSNLNNLSYLLVISFFSMGAITYSQTLSIKDHITMTNDLSDVSLLSFFKDEISNSQFILIGEEHGYKENSEITDLFFKLSQPFGYKYLCIETDAIAAQLIEDISNSKAPIINAQKLNQDFPFSIPFYNSPDDYRFFKNVVSNGGEIWGIDQSFMTQFRLNFSYLNSVTTNESLKEKLTKLENEAKARFQMAVKNRDFRAPFIFKYSDSLHNNLLLMCESPIEKKIIQSLKKSKEIYSFNFMNRPYLNNLYRSQLMKDNFLSFYKKSEDMGSKPKVIFKLGANHSGRGLNATNVYDVSNLLSELAIINGMSSTHILLKGIKGDKSIANPFADKSVMSYDNHSEIPIEVLELIKIHDFKYFILDLKPLREKAQIYSDNLSEMIYKFDVIIFINNTEAKTIFN